MAEKNKERLFAVGDFVRVSYCGCKPEWGVVLTKSSRGGLVSIKNEPVFCANTDFLTIRKPRKGGKEARNIVAKIYSKYRKQQVKKPSDMEYCRGLYDAYDIAKSMLGSVMKTKKVDDLTIEELNEHVASTFLVDDYGRVFNSVGEWIGTKKSDKFNPRGTFLFDTCHNAQQAFQIIEREKISVYYEEELNYWQAYNDYSTDNPVISGGNTLLIAAMRCYVKSIKGDEVEV